MILVTVIWVLLMLTVIAWTYARQCQMELRMTGFQTNSTKAYYIARAGVARAISFLREDKLKDQGVLGEEDLIEIDDKDENWVYDHPAEAWGYNPEAYGIDPEDDEEDWGAYLEDRKKDAQGKLLVRVEDLSGRLNLNGATRIQIQRLLEVCGVEEDYAKALSAAIVDYIDVDEDPTIVDDVRLDGWEFGDQASEDTYYNPHQSPEEIEVSGPSLVMKNEPMSAVEELLLVPGMKDFIYYGEDENRDGELDDNENDGDESPPYDNADGELQLGLRDFVSVQSGLSTERIGRPNLNSAPFEVIQALLWGEEESEDNAADIAEKIVKYRDGGDRYLGSDDDKRFRTLPHTDENSDGIDAVGLDSVEADRAAQAFGVASDYFQVLSTGIVNDVKKTLKVSVLRSFIEQVDLNEGGPDRRSRFSRDEEPEEQVQILTINYEEEG